MSRRADVRWVVDGDEVAAWWYPPPSEEPAPCVILAHGLDGVREQRLDDYAERFRALGVACVVFDYRCFGASAGEPRQLVDVNRQLEDYRAAIEWARNRVEVDPERIVVWGTSLSGGHVVRLAAEDERIAAAIAQLPFADGLAQFTFFPLGQTLRLLWAGVVDQVGAWLGRAPRTIPLAAEPGGTAIITTPDGLPSLRAITPTPTNWRNELVARMTLRIGFYRPVREAPNVRCPLLVCMADGDRLAKPSAARRIARAAPRGELRRYRSGHFGLYVGKGFRRAMADQAEFVARHLELVAEERAA